MSISFDQRAVAFIDVLGFGGLVNASASTPSDLKKLDSLVELLSSAIPSLDRQVEPAVPVEAIPRHIYISDSIILSAPSLTIGTSKYDGLGSVVMRSIQIAQLLLGHGFLVRGGIDIGPAWHGESNIVGPAYQNAYFIECSRRDPGIALSAAATKAWQAGTLANSSMCLERDGAWIVNPLEEAYFPNAADHGGIEQTYRSFQKIAASKVGTALNDKARAKWQWFQGFLIDQCKNRQITI